MEPENGLSSPGEGSIEINMRLGLLINALTTYKTSYPVLVQALTILKDEIVTPSLSLETSEKEVSLIEQEYVEALLDTDALSDLFEALEMYLDRSELVPICLEVLTLIISVPELQEEVAYSVFEAGVVLTLGKIIRHLEHGPNVKTMHLSVVLIHKLVKILPSYIKKRHDEFVDLVTQIMYLHSKDPPLLLESFKCLDTLFNVTGQKTIKLSTVNIILGTLLRCEIQEPEFYETALVVLFRFYEALTSDKEAELHPNMLIPLVASTLHNFRGSSSLEEKDEVLVRKLLPGSLQESVKLACQELEHFNAIVPRHERKNVSDTELRATILAAKNSMLHLTLVVLWKNHAELFLQQKGIDLLLRCLELPIMSGGESFLLSTAIVLHYLCDTVGEDVWVEIQAKKSLGVILKGISDHLEAKNHEFVDHLLAVIHSLLLFENFMKEFERQKGMDTLIVVLKNHDKCPTSGNKAIEVLAAMFDAKLDLERAPSTQLARLIGDTRKLQHATTSDTIPLEMIKALRFVFASLPSDLYELSKCTAKDLMRTLRLKSQDVVYVHHVFHLFYLMMHNQQIRDDFMDKGVVSLIASVIFQYQFTNPSIFGSSRKLHPFLHTMVQDMDTERTLGTLENLCKNITVISDYEILLDSLEKVCGVIGCMTWCKETADLILLKTQTLEYLIEIMKVSLQDTKLLKRLGRILKSCFYAFNTMALAQRNMPFSLVNMVERLDKVNGFQVIAMALEEILLFRQEESTQLLYASEFVYTLSLLNPRIVMNRFVKYGWMSSALTILQRHTDNSNGTLEFVLESFLTALSVKSENHIDICFRSNGFSLLTQAIQNATINKENNATRMNERLFALLLRALENVVQYGRKEETLAHSMVHKCILVLRDALGKWSFSNSRRLASISATCKKVLGMILTKDFLVFHAHQLKNSLEFLMTNTINCYGQLDHLMEDFYVLEAMYFTNVSKQIESHKDYENILKKIHQIADSSTENAIFKRTIEVDSQVLDGIHGFFVQLSWLISGGQHLVPEQLEQTLQKTYPLFLHSKMGGHCLWLEQIASLCPEIAEDLVRLSSQTLLRNFLALDQQYQGKIPWKLPSVCLEVTSFFLRSSNFKPPTEEVVSFFEAFIRLTERHIALQDAQTKRITEELVIAGWGVAASLLEAGKMNNSNNSSSTSNSNVLTDTQHDQLIHLCLESLRKICFRASVIPGEEATAVTLASCMATGNFLRSSREILRIYIEMGAEYARKIVAHPTVKIMLASGNCVRERNHVHQEDLMRWILGVQHALVENHGLMYAERFHTLSVYSSQTLLYGVELLTTNQDETSKGTGFIDQHGKYLDLVLNPVEKRMQAQILLSLTQVLSLMEDKVSSLDEKSFHEHISHMLTDMDLYLLKCARDKEKEVNTNKTYLTPHALTLLVDYAKELHKKFSSSRFFLSAEYNRMLFLVLCLMRKVVLALNPGYIAHLELEVNPKINATMTSLWTWLNFLVQSSPCIENRVLVAFLDVATVYACGTTDAVANYVASVTTVLSSSERTFRMISDRIASSSSSADMASFSIRQSLFKFFKCFILKFGPYKYEEVGGKQMVIKLFKCFSSSQECRLALLEAIFELPKGVGHLIELLIVASSESGTASPPHSPPSQGSKRSSITTPTQVTTVQPTPEDVLLQSEIIAVFNDNFSVLRQKTSRVTEVEMKAILSLIQSNSIGNEHHLQHASTSLKVKNMKSSLQILEGTLALLKSLVRIKRYAVVCCQANGLGMLYQCMSTCAGSPSIVTFAVEIASSICSHKESLQDPMLSSIIKQLFVLADATAPTSNMNVQDYIRPGMNLLEQCIEQEASALVGSAFMLQVCRTQLESWKETYVSQLNIANVNEMIQKLDHLYRKVLYGEVRAPTSGSTTGSNGSQGYFSGLLSPKYMQEEVQNLIKAISNGYCIVEFSATSAASINTRSTSSGVFYVNTATGSKTAGEPSEYIAFCKALEKMDKLLVPIAKSEAADEGAIALAPPPPPVSPLENFPAAAGDTSRGTSSGTSSFGPPSTLPPAMTVMNLLNESFLSNTLPFVCKFISLHTLTTDQVLSCMNLISKVSFSHANILVQLIDKMEFGAFLTACTVHSSQSLPFAVLASIFCENLAAQIQEQLLLKQKRSEHQRLEDQMAVMELQEEQGTNDFIWKQLIKFICQLLVDWKEDHQVVTSCLSAFRALFQTIEQTGQEDLLCQVHQAYETHHVIDLLNVCLRLHMKETLVTWYNVQCILELLSKSPPTVPNDVSDEEEKIILQETASLFLRMLKSFYQNANLIEMALKGLEQIMYRCSRLHMSFKLWLLEEQEAVVFLMDCLHLYSENPSIVAAVLRLLLVLGSSSRRLNAQRRRSSVQATENYTIACPASVVRLYVDEKIPTALGYLCRRNVNQMDICLTGVEILMRIAEAQDDNDIEEEKEEEEEQIEVTSKSAESGGRQSLVRVVEKALINEEMLRAVFFILDSYVQSSSRGISTSFLGVLLEFLYDLTRIEKGRELVEKLDGLTSLKETLLVIWHRSQFHLQASNYKSVTPAFTAIGLLESSLDCLVNLACSNRNLHGWHSYPVLLLQLAESFHDQQISSGFCLEKIVGILTRLAVNSSMSHDITTFGAPILLEILTCADQDRFLELGLFNLLSQLCSSHNNIPIFIVFDVIPITFERILFHLEDQDVLFSCLKFLLLIATSKNTECIYALHAPNPITSVANIPGLGNGGGYIPVLRAIMEQYHHVSRIVKIAREIVDRMEEHAKPIRTKSPKSAKQQPSIETAASVKPLPGGLSMSMSPKEMEEENKRQQQEQRRCYFEEILSNGTLFQVHWKAGMSEKKIKKDKRLEIMSLHLSDDGQYLILRNHETRDNMERIFLNQVEILDEDEQVEPASGLKPIGNKPKKSHSFRGLFDKAHLKLKKKCIQILVRKELVWLEAATMENKREWQNALMWLLRERDQIDPSTGSIASKPKEITKADRIQASLSFHRQQKAQTSPRKVNHSTKIF